MRDENNPERRRWVSVRRQFENGALEVGGEPGPAAAGQHGFGFGIEIGCKKKIIIVIRRKQILSQGQARPVRARQKLRGSEPFHD
jgi:hypothetical protein